MHKEWDCNDIGLDSDLCELYLREEREKNHVGKPQSLTRGKMQPRNQQSQIKWNMVGTNGAISFVLYNWTTSWHKNCSFNTHKTRNKTVSAFDLLKISWMSYYKKLDHILSNIKIIISCFIWSSAWWLTKTLVDWVCAFNSRTTIWNDITQYAERMGNKSSQATLWSPTSAWVTLHPFSPSAAKPLSYPSSVMLVHFNICLKRKKEGTSWNFTYTSTGVTPINDDNSCGLLCVS